ncbi:leucyl aminopeptidase [bacterium]|nr:leucyl aminopeptidase [bacterium]
MSSYLPKSAVVVLHNTKEFKALDKKTAGQLSSVCTLNGFAEATTAEVTVSYPSKLNVDSVTVVKTDADSNQDWRNFGGRYAKMHKGKVENLYFDIEGTNEGIYEGAMLALYTFDKYKTVKRNNTPLNIMIDVIQDASIHNSVYFARDVITEPGNVLYPASFAQRINDELTPLGVGVRILHQSQLETMGFGLLLSVGQGSVKDSYVVVMEWMNGGDEAPLALVGKGVTFDTGGISIKPSAGMGDMKYDMGGSGAVVGAMHAIASQEVPHNVIGIVGLVENMPDGNAIKPGDVVASLDGQTVENLNTDAEGRLVLADILTYVQNEYKPDRIIDLATLTGAIVVSLGGEAAGVFTNSTAWGQSIRDAGKRSGEAFWHMPMGQNWNKMIDSDIADMKNIGGKGSGSTTAAEFLYRFVDPKVAWAHLDIAGVCWDDKGNDTVPGGAVGFGVRTLLDIATQGLEMPIIDEEMKY